ncbi:MAG TPA: STM3941 family protein [Pyrinomonadaceae bacterium]|jgi:hypothetical protein
MERIEINPPAWKMALLILGMAAFVFVGLLMVVFGDLFAKALGAISIIFFGGVCGYGLYARSRGQGKVAILPAGVEVGLPGMNPRVLPWGDIEAFGVNRIGNQEFTTVRVRSYRAWLSGISPEEAAAALRFFRGLGQVAHATASMVEYGDPAGDMRRLTEGSAEVRSLAGVLAYNREKYGGEFLLGWTMRDRGARQFAEFLEQCRRNGR